VDVGFLLLLLTFWVKCMFTACSCLCLRACISPIMPNQPIVYYVHRVEFVRIAGTASVGYFHVARLAPRHTQLWRRGWPAETQAIFGTRHRVWNSGQRSSRGAAVPSEAWLLVFGAPARQVCSHCCSRGERKFWLTYRSAFMRQCGYRSTRVRRFLGSEFNK